MSQLSTEGLFPLKNPQGSVSFGVTAFQAVVVLSRSIGFAHLLALSLVREIVGFKLCRWRHRSSVVLLCRIFGSNMSGSY